MKGSRCSGAGFTCCCCCLQWHEDLAQPLSLSPSPPPSFLSSFPPSLPAARRGAQTPVPARRPARDAGQGEAVGEAVGEARGREGKGKGSLPARGDARWHRPAPAAQALEPAAARRLLLVPAPCAGCPLAVPVPAGAPAGGEGRAGGCSRRSAGARFSPPALGSSRRAAGLFEIGKVCVSSGPFGLLRKPDLFVFT